MITDEQREQLGLVDERKDFYFKVENAVIDNDDIFDNIYESMIYIILSRYCNGGQVAFPSISTLAKKCYCSESTIKRNLKTLIEKNLIKKVVRYDAENKVYSSSLYAIVNIVQYVEVGSHRPKGGFSENQGVGSHRPKGGFSETYKEELIKEEQIKQQQDKKVEVVVDDSLLKKAEEEAKKNPSVKNPEVYAKGMVENGWKPEEVKMNPKFDTRGTDYIDITDEKVKDTYFNQEESLEIDPEDEKRALKILKQEGTYNFFMNNKSNKKMYINALKLALAGS